MNSMPAVAGISRRAVGIVTAAFVLLCHVYCACGAARAPGTAADNSTQPPCHRHHGGNTKSKQGNPAPSHDGGACHHCKRAVTAEGSGSKPPTDLKPAALPASLIP